MPMLTLKHCSIADVLIDPEHNGKRIVKIRVNEEDFFEMLDHVNPKNLVKYLDMRKIPHRDALVINVQDPKAIKKGIRKSAGSSARGLYGANKRNRKKLNRALELLESMQKNEKL